MNEDDEAIPPFLRLTPEERKKTWNERQPSQMAVSDPIMTHQEEMKAARLAAKNEETAKKRAAAEQKSKARDPVDRTGQTWDPRRCQWVQDCTQPKQEDNSTMIQLTTNTRGATQMANTDYGSMTMSDLVAAYNKVAPKPVKRFTTLAAGVKRMKALETKKTNGAAAPKKAASGRKTELTGKAAKVAEEFAFRADSPREKLLVALVGSFGKQVPIKTLAREVFGSASDQRVADVVAVSKGLPWRIKESRLKYEFRKETKDGEGTLGLHAK